MSRRRRRRQTGREFVRELLIDLGLRAFFIAFMFIVVMPLVLLWAQSFKLHISTPSPRASTVASEAAAGSQLRGDSASAGHSQPRRITSPCRGAPPW